MSYNYRHLALQVVCSPLAPQGWTPLQSAVSCGHEEVVALLLRLGADVGAANSGGRTALHYAVRRIGGRGQSTGNARRGRGMCSAGGKGML